MVACTCVQAQVHDLISNPSSPSGYKCCGWVVCGGGGGGGGGGRDQSGEGGFLSAGLPLGMGCE